MHMAFPVSVYPIYCVVVLKIIEYGSKEDLELINNVASSVPPEILNKSGKLLKLSKRLSQLLTSIQK